MTFSLRAAGAASILFVFVACSTTSSSTPGPLGSDGGGDVDGSTDPDGGTTPKPDGGTTLPDGAPAQQFTQTNETMQSFGRTRSYVLFVPKPYDGSKKYPLVLSLHGEPGSGAGQHNAFPFEQASGADAIVAFPDGTSGAWDLVTAPASNADMTFLKELVDEIASKYNVDKTRAFATGYSNGAFMANQMACRFAGLFKGVASHAGGQPQEIGGDTKYGSNGCIQCPGGATAAIIVHGTGDGVVSLDTGLYAARCQATNNGCTDANPPATGVSPAPCAKFDGCNAGKDVHYCAIAGLGHTQWAQGDATAWAFFKGLP